MGQILTLQQKQKEAAPHFDRAIELRGDFPEALIAAGKLRNEARQYDEAAKLLERAVKLQPRSEAAHYNLMMAYRNAGRDADAQREKAELEKLQKPPEGEFSDFLKRLGDKSCGEGSGQVKKLVAILCLAASGAPPEFRNVARQSGLIATYFRTAETSPRNTSSRPPAAVSHSSTTTMTGCPIFSSCRVPAGRTACITTRDRASFAT